MHHEVTQEVRVPEPLSPCSVVMRCSETSFVDVVHRRKVPSDIAHLHGRFVLCNFTSVTWSVSNRCGLGSHLIALGAVPSLFHPQTATLYLELVHAFCFRRYPLAASECVKVLQNCVCYARRRAPRRLSWRSAAVSLLTCLNPAVVGKDHS